LRHGADKALVLYSFPAPVPGISETVQFLRIRETPLDCLPPPLCQVLAGFRLQELSGLLAKMFKQVAVNDLLLCSRTGTPM